MIHPKILLRIMGTLLLIEGGMLLICFIMSLCYREPDQNAFLYSLLIAYGLGIIMKFMGRHSGNDLNRREGYFVVSITWIVFSLIGMLPFLFGGYAHSAASAFFETMSGFTTTGATVFNGIDSMPHAILFWRSMTHWIGGLGIVFFTLTILPSVGQGAIKLFSAEATGPTHEKLHPRIKTTAKWLWSLYVVLTAGCAVGLWLCGMNWFDSINHAMSTTSTGGFSTHSSGIMFYHSPAIEYVEIIFMFLSGANFSLLYLTGKKHRLRTLIQDGEFRFYLWCVLIVSAICTLPLIILSGYTPEHAIRASLFNVISLQTTTGFVSDDFGLWLPFVWLFLILVMLIGSCAGSTAGGIKCIRAHIIVKTAVCQFKRLVHPNAIIPVHINHTPISESVERTLIAFLFWFFCLIGIGTLSLILMNVPILDSFTISVSCISNVGPSIGHVYGPLNNLASLPDLGKWICSFLMLAGRLEIFSVLLPLAPSFWKMN